MWWDLPRRLAPLLAVPLLLAATLAPPAPPGGDSGAGPAGDPGADRLAASGVVAPPEAPAPPAVAATAWLVADLGDGSVLAARNARERRYPASTLKMLTALALLPRLDPAATYVAQRADVAVEGSKVGLVEGGRYPVRQLFEGLFLASGNDAAAALAAAGGGTEATVALMQAEAARLGARDTTVRNPSGLDDDGQLTTAYDLALMARAGMARADFREYAGTLRSTFPGRDGSTFQVWNLDRFLSRYPGAVGIKNGYTTKARNTLVAAATRDGRTLVATLLDSPGRTWDDAAALLDWGFARAAAPGGAPSVGRLVAPAAPRAEPAPAGSAGPAGPASAATLRRRVDTAAAWSGVLGVAILLRRVARAYRRRRAPSGG